MEEQKMNNVSGQDVKVSQRHPQGRKRVRPLTMKADALMLGSFVRCINAMSRNYGLRAESMQVLLLLNEHWTRERRGIAISTLSRSCTWYRSSNSHEIIRQRILILLEKGLVEVVGKGKRDSNQYAPTRRTSQELSEMTAFIQNG